MPIKHRIRSTSKRQKIEKQGVMKGKKPHRLRNAHSVLATFPYIKAILLWMLSVVVFWAAIGLFGYGIYKESTKIIVIGLAVFGFWLVLKLGLHLACKATTCPLCRAYHYVGGRSSKHIKAYRIWPFSYSTTAILTSIFRRCVRCMHCGVTFDITKRNR